MPGSRVARRWRAALTVLPLLLGGCAARADGTEPGRIRVVASTDVYGDLARTVGGAAVQVSSLLDSPAQDPHSFEASARDQLALSKAQVVVLNGGGYDPWASAALQATGATPRVLTAVTIAGTRARIAGEINEHVWYDLATVRRIVSRLAAVLGALDPAAGHYFDRRAAGLRARLLRLEASERAIRARHAAAGVVVTEPLPLHLLLDCGLVDRTPPGLSAAVEEGGDVPPALLEQVLHVLADHRTQLLATTVQSAGPETSTLVAAAARDGVPSVRMSETLPPGEHYVGWMARTLAAVRSALDGGS